MSAALFFCHIIVFSAVRVAKKIGPGGRSSRWGAVRVEAVPLGSSKFRAFVPFPAQHYNDVFFSCVFSQLWWCLEATIHRKSAGHHEGFLEEVF